MSKKRAKDFREERASDLLKLSELLEGSIPGFNAGSLKAAANQCKSKDLPSLADWQFPKSKYTWGYKIDYLLFYDYQPSSDLRPVAAKEQDVLIQLDVTIIGQSNSEGTADPLSVLVMELQISGQKEKRQLFGAWHLDKHKRVQGDSEKAAHPEYHMQYGGKNLWKNVKDYGGLILPEPPRFAHPPLDGVLAVDFVLSNFFWEEWRRLAEESVYIELVSRAQELFWRPYTKALAAAWNPGPYEDEAWAANLIWPQLRKSIGL